TKLDPRCDLAEQRDLESANHGIRNFGLQLQHVTKISVVRLGPEVKTGDGVVELYGYADRVARATHASFENGGHIELAGDRADVSVLPLERERRRARRHLQLVDSGQRVQ